MAVVNPYTQYRQVQVSTSNQLNLIVMLYDGAIQFLNRAVQAKVRGDESEAGHLTGRAQDIVFELWATLDLDAGELAGNLYRLYEYISGRLSTAQAKMDTELLRESVELLSGLREAWRQIGEPGGFYGQSV